MSFSSSCFSSSPSAETEVEAETSGLYVTEYCQPPIYTGLRQELCLT